MLQGGEVIDRQQVGVAAGLLVALTAFARSAGYRRKRVVLKNAREFQMFPSRNAAHGGAILSRRRATGGSIEPP